MREIFPNVFLDEGKRKKLYTRNMIPGKKAHQENLYFHNGTEYREWNPTRSKLGAAIARGLKLFPIKEGSKILYLGAASGNTCSYISDIIGPEGMIYAIEFSPRVARQLVYLCEVRPNISPILADASKPETYLPGVLLSDLVFQDIAQRDQVEIFLKNCRMYLKKGGYAMIALKSRSIDVSKNPRLLYMEAKNMLSKEMIVHEMLILDPFEKDHAFFLCQKK